MCIIIDYDMFAILNEQLTKISANDTTSYRPFTIKTKLKYLNSFLVPQFNY